MWRSTWRPSTRLCDVEVHLETGRTHQIRVHFSALRHPCVGDLTSGPGAGCGVVHRLDVGTAIACSVVVFVVITARRRARRPAEAGVRNPCPSRGAMVLTTCR